MTNQQGTSLYIEASIYRNEDTGEYRTRLETSAGVADVPFTLFALPEIGREISALRERILFSASEPFREVQHKQRSILGEKLFTSLFQGKALELYRICSRQLEASPHQRLLVKINPTTYELATLPWELLYDPNKDFLALDRRTPIIRFIPEKPPHPMTFDPDWRILLIASNPPGTPTLDLMGEMKQIEGVFAEAAPHIELKINYLLKPSTREFRDKLRRFDPHILHFMGHGDAGRLLLEDPAQGAVSVDETNLAVILRNIPALRLVFLNACESAAAKSEQNLGMAHALSRAGIPAVVANQFPTRDDAAREMSDEFYRVLASGLPVDEAVLWGRIAVRHLRATNSSKTIPTMEWATPVLYLQAPDGYLFKDLLQRQGLAEVPAGQCSRDEEPTLVPGLRTSEKPPVWQDTQSERVQSLKKQLALHRRNLTHLEEQRIKSGSTNIPLNLFNQIEDTNKEIARLEEALASLGEKIGAATPSPQSPPKTPTPVDVSADPKLQELQQKAEQHLKDREWNEAIDLLEEIDRAWPDYPPARIMLQTAREEQGKVRRQQLHEQRRMALLKEARIHWNEGKEDKGEEWQKALGLLDEILAEDQGFAGGEAARLQRTVKAAYDDYLRKRKTWQKLKTLYEAAQRAIGLEKWHRAIPLLQNVVELDSQYEDAAQLLQTATRQALLADLYEQGDAAYQRRHWADAVECFGNIQSLEEKYRDVPQKFDEARRQLRWDRLYDEGLAYLDRRDWSNAVEVLSQVEPDDNQRRGQKRDLAYAQAMLAYTRATELAEKQADRPVDWEEVINLLNPIVDESPGYREAARILQEARRCGRWAKIYEEGQRYLKAKSWAAAIQSFEIITREKQDYRDAFEQLQEAQKQQRLSEHYEKGSRFLEWENWQEAFKEFQAILSVAPDYRDARQLSERAEKQIRLAELYGQAMKDYGDDRLDAALANLEGLVTEEPEYRGGEAKALLDKWEKEKEIRKAYKEGEDCFRKGNWNLAVQAFERISKIQPGVYPEADAKLQSARLEMRLDSLYNEAMNLISDQQWEKASAVLKEIQGLRANYRATPDLLKKAEEEGWLKSQYQQARQYQVAEQWDRAAEVLESIRLRRDGYADVKERLAEVHRQRQLSEWYSAARRAFEAENWPEAVALLQKIREQGARDYKDVAMMYSHAERNKKLVELYGQAETALGRGDLDTAEGKLAEALGIDEGYRDVQVKLAEVRRKKRLQNLYTQAQAAFANGRWDEAITAYRQVLDIEPGYEEVKQLLQETEKRKKLASLYVTAEQSMSKEDWREAIGHLQAILELDENYRDARAMLERAKRLEEAHKIYQRALERESEGDTVGALERYEIVRKMDPNFGDVASRVARLTRTLEFTALYKKAMDALSQPHFVEAIPLLLNLQKLDPANEEVQARLRQAINDHRRALFDRYQKAQRLKREGRSKEARAEFEKYQSEKDRSPWL